VSASHVAAVTETGEVVTCLLKAGAMGNVVDNIGHTTGDIALSFNDASESIYVATCDAGLRSGRKLA